MQSKKDLESICKQCLSLSYQDGYTQFSYIDANDGAKWRVAQIIGVANNSLEIHYEGWTIKYDEKNLPKTAAKLAPFRSCSRGYTGQNIQAYRDFNFETSECLNKQTTLQKLISSNLDNTIGISAYELTQLIRGELFFYCDSLLSLAHYYRPNLENLQKVYETIGLYLDMILLWLEKFPLWKNEYELCKKYKYLYLIDYETALACCSNEFEEILRNCFGSDWNRLEKSFCVFFLYEVSEIVYGCNIRE